MLHEPLSDGEILKIKLLRGQAVNHFKASFENELVF